MSNLEQPVIDGVAYGPEVRVVGYAKVLRGGEAKDVGKRRSSGCNNHSSRDLVDAEGEEHLHLNHGVAKGIPLVEQAAVCLHLFVAALGDILGRLAVDVRGEHIALDGHGDALERVLAEMYFITTNFMYAAGRRRATTCGLKGFLRHVVMGPSGWPLGCSGVFGSRLSKMCLMPCTELASWNGGHFQHRLAVASIAPDACGSKT